MNGDQERAGDDAGAGRTGGDQAVEDVADAVSTAVSSVRRQLARVHAGLPPLEEDPHRDDSGNA
ncbi:hypothetical protein [Streptomyces sp. NPDC055287]